MTAFADTYTRYIESAQRARSEGKLEQERKRLFFGFLQEAFGILFENFEIEKRVQLSHSSRGFIDAIFGDLVFEFKQDLTRNHKQTLDQLTDYLNSDEMRDQDYIGVLSDGLRFEIYARDGDELRELDTFELKLDQPEDAFARLDAYLFSQKAMRPTAQDIVTRFGATSPSFRAGFARLSTLLSKTHYSALAVWREQWDKLLSKVYGDRIAGDEGDALYVKHTYLCQFAKLLAYGALNGTTPQTASDVERIISGEAFKKDRVTNIGESDFFSWVLLDDIKDEALELFRRLAAGLLVYRLDQIDQDLLKQLYQNLVGPSTRHDLGEYYTPDWLAELVLEDIGYGAPQSLLDPACGSGSFLFAAIKRLEQQGMHGAELVRFAADNIVGLDVHPLAVTIARLNFVLALSAALRDPASASVATFPVPIFMADALQTTGTDAVTSHTLVIPVRDQERFSVPLNIARKPQRFGEIIDQMEIAARRAAGDDAKLISFSGPFLEFVSQNSDPVMSGVTGDIRPMLWGNNLRLLAKLVGEGRNGIWAYILKNQARPLMLAERKFDCIVGNPPWLSYRYIKNREYQDEVKRLTIEYELIEGKSVKLFTQIELCTLFAVHAERHYMKPGGTLAFVMPRSVITGAKQHRPFQARGLTRVIDLLGVHPLFNVPSCVTIIQGARSAAPVPSRVVSGRLPRHEMSLDEAHPKLSEKAGQVTFVDSDVRSSYYYDKFQQGATLVPRNFCLVVPEGDPAAPMFVSDPEADNEAKAPYKGVTLRGHIDSDFLYATLLSKHLLPFGYEKLHLVALPVLLQADGSLRMLEDELAFFSAQRAASWAWFERASEKWDELSKGALSFFEQLNYRNKITSQRPNDGYRVVYNTSGSNLTSCVYLLINSASLNEAHRLLITDHKTYDFVTQSADEAHYLSALLNSPVVNTAIKSHQSSGSFGERDIHRTPFEACDIPPFDEKDTVHLQLAALSSEAHSIVDELKSVGKLKGGVVAMRRQVRKAVAPQIEAIDVLARKLLGL
ncbi:MAG: N-6 DNA methylase [Chloroflexi bacterium OLB13]|nr:MAG: N-6 DNA methylase [Chloroflexi bacterium OLB13]